MPDVAYTVQITKSAKKVLAKLPRDVLARIMSAITSLGTNPRPVNSKKLVGHDFYRIRVGDWRVLYAIDDEVVVVLVLDVGARGNVYQDL